MSVKAHGHFVRYFHHVCLNSLSLSFQDPFIGWDTFDLKILELANSTEVTELTKNVANLRNFRRRKFYLKTKFHKAFCLKIKKARDNLTLRIEEDEYITFSGIEGIGKTSSVIYYWLSCLLKKDNSINYIDLEVIAEDDKDLKHFSNLARDFSRDLSHTLFVDHVTVFNQEYIAKIKKVAPHSSLILIEKGFTASAHQNNVQFSREYQLDEEEFEKVWISIAKSSSHMKKEAQHVIEKAHDVYSCFSKCALMTARVAQYVFNIMFVHEIFDPVRILMSYLETQKQKIETFFKMDHDCLEIFLMHTKCLLHVMSEGGDYILTEKQYGNVYVATNIFEVEHLTISKEDLMLEQFLSLELAEGDGYVKLSLLVPELGSYWKEYLPYKQEALLKYENPTKLVEIMFQNGGARKEIKKMIIQFQKMTEEVIVPEMNTTSVHLAADICTTQIQLSNYALVPMGEYYDPGLDELSFIETDFKLCEKNVARCALWMIKKMNRTSFMFYPQIENLMGVDYFIYRFVRSDEDIARKAKKPRLEHVLYLVQVATGGSHRGDTFQRAQDIVKKILCNENVKVQAILLVSTRSLKPFKLTKCQLNFGTFVINMCEKSLLHKIDACDKCLSKFLIHGASLHQ